MKQRNIAVFLIMALMIGVGSLFPATKAEAGKKVTILDSSTLEDTSYWYCPEKDVVTQDGKLIFTEDSADYTKFISRLSLNANQNSEEFVVVEGQVKFNKIPQGQSFVIALGVKEMEPSLGDAENVEVTFTNHGGIKFSVNAYDADGNQTVVCASKNSGISVGRNANIRIAITKDSTLKVAINGSSVCSGKLPVSGGGKVAFLQTGGCAAEISNLTIKGYEYDRPENTNVSEDFEKGIDISKIDLANTYEVGGNLMAPGRVVVEEYKGNNVLMMVNAGGYYFTTKYQYSNFEMTFDVPYAQMSRDMLYDDGTGYFYSFGVLFGVSSDANASWTGTDAVEGVLFERSGKVSSVKTKGFEKVAEAHPFGKEFQPFTVKLSVVDGNVTVGIKWVTEKDYEILGNYVLDGGSPTGYIRFAIPDIGNMAIDNLKITNLDENPSLIETEYKNGIETFEDAKYEPFERVYKDEKVKVDAEIKPAISWYWLLPVSAVIGAAIIGISFAVAKGKEKRRKEAAVNEA